MGFFSNELSNVVEWNETNPNVLFWKWTNKEIKKGSVLVIRPGQDAIFLYNGRVEGVFEDEGRYDIESQIVPFLSTLKGFKFGFNSGLRAEVLFINTKEILCKWGTKNPVAIQAPGLPGGMPIRAFGTYNCRIADYMVVIEKLAGIKQMYRVEDVRERMTGILDQLVMRGISKEGKDIYNLQMYATEIANSIQSDLDYELRKVGISISDFRIESFSYPEQVKQMQEKAAAQAMIGDMDKYTKLAFADGMQKGGGSRGNIAADMVQMQMGINMAQQMNAAFNNNMAPQGYAPQQAAPQPQATDASGNAGAIPKFCPNCGTATTGTNFCGNCGNKLV